MSARVVVSVAIVAGCFLGWGPARRGSKAATPPPATVAVRGAPPLSGNAPAPRPIASVAAKAGAAAIDSGEDIRDIHGPIPIPSQRSAWWVVAEVSVLSTAIVAFILYARRRKPVLSPDQRALQALRGTGSLVGGDARAFSFAVSEIVRVYVEEAFHLRASHRTTDELLAELMQDNSPVASHRADLGDFLHHCDLAKFAGWSLPRADMEAMLSSAETFVRATAPASITHTVSPAARRDQGVAVA